MWNSAKRVVDSPPTPLKRGNLPDLNKKRRLASLLFLRVKCKITYFTMNFCVSLPALMK